MEVLGRKELLLVIEAIGNSVINDFHLTDNEKEILEDAKQKLEINYKQLMEMLGKHNKGGV